MSLSSILIAVLKSFSWLIKIFLTAKFLMRVFVRTVNVCSIRRGFSKESIWRWKWNWKNCVLLNSQSDWVMYASTLFHPFLMFFATKSSTCFIIEAITGDTAAFWRSSTPHSLWLLNISLARTKPFRSWTWVHRRGYRWSRFLWYGRLSLQSHSGSYVHRSRFPEILDSATKFSPDFIWFTSFRSQKVS